jgi:hypothetical protein
MTIFLTLAFTPLTSYVFYLCYFTCLFHAFGVLHPVSMLLHTCLFHFLSVTFHESFVTVRKAKQGPPQAAKERMPRLAKTKHADFPSWLVINRPGGQGEGHKINTKQNIYQMSFVVICQIIPCLSCCFNSIA